MSMQQITAQQVARRIAYNPHLATIARAMPRTVGAMARVAFACQPRERWQVYEQLKRTYEQAATRYNAAFLPGQEQLGGRHHEAMMELLDWLLPQEVAAIAGEEE